MADEKRHLNDQDYLLAELVVKVAALERLLVKSGIVSSDDLVKEMENISKEVVSFMNSFNLKQAIQTPDTDKNKN